MLRLSFFESFFLGDSDPQPVTKYRNTATAATDARQVSFRASWIEDFGIGSIYQD
jgi:hypothetical protein